MNVIALFSICYQKYNAPLMSIKIAIHLSYNLAISFLGIYPIDVITNKQNDLCNIITALLSVTVKDWKQAKCPYIGHWHGKTQAILLGRTNKCRSVCLRVLPVDMGVEAVR